MDKRASKTIMKIYEGFSSCLARTNFTNLKVRDILKDAGISPTGFYSHFKSKDEVLQGFLARLFLSVKIRGQHNGKDRISLLFARISSNEDLLKNCLLLPENKALLRESMIPWCKSFLPVGKDKASKNLASCMLADSILLFLKEADPKEKAAVAAAFKQALTALCF